MKMLIPKATTTQKPMAMNRWCINVKTSKASIPH